MLTHLIIDNFKAFGTRQEIPLAPITLIFGANSAGKSSILQALLLLKQSIENAESPDQFLLFKGESVDLGSFPEMVFAHDITRKVEISLLSDRPRLEPRKVRGRPTPAPPDLQRTEGGAGLSFEYDRERRMAVPDAIPVYLRDATGPAFTLARLRPASESGRGHFQIRSSLRRHMSQDAATGPLFESSVHLDEEHQIWESWWREFRERSVAVAAGTLDVLGKQIQEQSRRGSRPSGQDETWYAGRTLEMFASSSKRLDLSQIAPQQRGQLSTEEIRSEIEGWQRKLRGYEIGDFLGDVRRTESPEVTVELRNCVINDVSVDIMHPLDVLLDPIYGLPEENRISSRHRGSAIRVPNLAQLAHQTSTQLRRELKDLVYLGPLRGYPERHYIVGGRETTTVGKRGSFTPDILFANPHVANRANEQIQKFGFGYELKMRELVDKDTPENQGDVFSLRLVDQSTQTNVSLVDVGFGISQVLPVIVQSMLSRGNTIAIEQPEIHLHPGLQAELGSLFAECISEPNNNRFIIETHSEHLILRLQRLIRRGELKPKDVSVLYVSRTSGDEGTGSTVQQLLLDDDGEFISEWPDGFFEEGYREMFGQ